MFYNQPRVEHLTLYVHAVICGGTVSAETSPLSVTSLISEVPLIYVLDPQSIYSSYLRQRLVISQRPSPGTIRRALRYGGGLRYDTTKV